MENSIGIVIIALIAFFCWVILLLISGTKKVYYLSLHTTEILN